ncbi:hypothetical protein GH721_08710 [Kriegella sp. EG-1]|nr:hypothetical protein [Flavobacteriaceae bacterium EG-1]
MTIPNDPKRINGHETYFNNAPITVIDMLSLKNKEDLCSEVVIAKMFT